MWEKKQEIQLFDVAKYYAATFNIVSISTLKTHKAWKQPESKFIILYTLLNVSSTDKKQVAAKTLKEVHCIFVKRPWPKDIVLV